MKLLKQIDEDGACIEFTNKAKPVNTKLEKVFQQTKRIIISYRKKEQLWKLEKIELKNKISSLEKRILQLTS